jgi:hypothetical protein
MFLTWMLNQNSGGPQQNKQQEQAQEQQRQCLQDKQHLKQYGP